jgi:prefoldin subunit 5
MYFLMFPRRFAMEKQPENSGAKLVDLNSASMAELKKLPGVGSATAKRIIAARPFTKLQDLRHVKGIDKAIFEKLKPLVWIPADDSGRAVEETVVWDEELVNQLAAPQEDETPEVQIPAPEEPAEIKESQNYPDRDSSAAGAVEPLAAAAEATQAPEKPEPVQVAASDIEMPEPVQVAVHAVEKPETVQKVAPASEKSAPEKSEPVQAAGPAPETPAPPQTAAAWRGVSLSGAIGIAVVSSLLTLILSIAAVLGILSTLNGGLNYASPDQLASLQRKANTLDSQITTIDGEISTLRERLDNLDALSGRLNATENEVQKLRNEVQAAALQTEKIGQQVEGLTTSIRDIKASVQRFQEFLDGLRKLVNPTSSQP